jgi:catechol 2,3-dioxygenase-like lactoylglutathione lyase family enzyme
MNAWDDVRPVFFVEDVERSLAFYTDQLGFTETNRYAEDGKVLVGGVARDRCPLLLSCQWPQKNGYGRYWIRLGRDAYQAFRRELEGKGVPVKDGWWGMDTMIVEDPDGNELFFPAPESDGENA